MPASIEMYKKHREELIKVKQWVSMLGKQYEGGGGGLGRVVKVKLSTNDPFVIYYQEYDAATNYHCAPDSFKEYLELAIIDHSESILKSALKDMENDLKAKAMLVQKEYEELINIIGEKE